MAARYFTTKPRVTELQASMRQLKRMRGGGDSGSGQVKEQNEILTRCAQRKQLGEARRPGRHPALRQLCLLRTLPPTLRFLLLSRAPVSSKLSARKSAGQELKQSPSRMLYSSHAVRAARLPRRTRRTATVKRAATVPRPWAFGKRQSLAETRLRPAEARRQRLLEHL